MSLNQDQNYKDKITEKQELEMKIAESEKVLLHTIEKVEELKINLSSIKQEYDIKIGKLYLRLDEIELEILKYKKIEDALNNNITFKEAEVIVEEKIKKNRERIFEQYHKLDEDEKIYKDRKNIPEDEKDELKKLWYKLALKHHPDLSHGNEEIMKKINKAYEDGDIDTLRMIDNGQINDDSESNTIESLKIKLEDLKKSINKADNELNEMIKSEWYTDPYPI